MRIKGYSTYIRNLLLPTIVYSGLVGIFTGIIIFFYKWGASKLLGWSHFLYAYTRSHPAFIPLMFLALCGLAVIMALVIKFAPQSKGGGIPTSEGILRGQINFNWIRTFFGMIVNSYISFFAGLPLGNEGPSVQIGTAIGRGTRKTFLQPDIAWDRYVMTAGASAGFAVATCAPITGMLFALEEAHKRFSPMILSVSFISVTIAVTIANALGGVFNIEMTMFTLDTIQAIPLKFFWVAIVLGVVIGLFSALFIILYKKIGDFNDKKCKKLPLMVKLIIVFVLTGIFGLLFDETLTGGHDLIQHIFQGSVLWYVLLITLIIKFLMISIANSTGATGGLFIPILTLGAIIGGLFNYCFARVIPSQYASAIISISICAYLGATIRAPMSAIVFGIETMQGLSNTLYISIAVIVAYILLEMLDIKPLYDIVLERALKAQNEGKTRQLVERVVTVKPKAFVIGKQTRDIFWPTSCLVLGIKRDAQNAKSSMDNDGEKIIHLNDQIALRYQTYNDEETFALIEELVGKQDNNEIYSSNENSNENVNFNN